VDNCRSWLLWVEQRFSLHDKESCLQDQESCITITNHCILQMQHHQSIRLGLFFESLDSAYMIKRTCWRLLLIFMLNLEKHLRDAPKIWRFIFWTLYALDSQTNSLEDLILESRATPSGATNRRILLKDPSKNNILHVRFGNTSTPTVNTPSNIQAWGLRIHRKGTITHCRMMGQGNTWQKALCHHLMTACHRMVQRAG
jgi:hypothetical protein